MERVCPYCGREVSTRVRCSACHSEIAWAQKIYEKAEIYYLKGYNEAKIRNLETAASYLRKAVFYNKYHINARNLLGLIYYETGEVGAALKEWIISSSLDKEDLVAAEYIKMVQDAPNALVDCKESISLYNKALSYLEQDHGDVATIRLKKAVKLNPNFVKARVLLALCYIQEKQFRKANEQVKAALEISNDQVEALRYYKLLAKEDTTTVQPYEMGYQPVKANGNANGLTERKSIYMRSVMYFALGAVCTGIIGVGLVIPSKVDGYKNQVTQLKASEANLQSEIAVLESDQNDELTALKEENEKLSKDKSQYESEALQLKQQEKLSEAEDLMSEWDYVGAAEAIYSISTTSLSEESKEEYEQLKADCYMRAASDLFNEAYNLYYQEEYVEAKGKLETALLYEPEEYTARRSLYYLGEIEYQQNSLEQAKSYYEKVINDYPGTNEAYMADSRIEEINNTDS